MIEKLFTSKTRTKILMLLLLSKREFNMRQIEKEIGVNISAVKREIDNLETLSIVVKDKGKYKANEDCPFIGSLKDILIKTDGIFEVLKECLPKKIEFAFVFGSFANNEYGADSDVDLFVVGKVNMAGVVKAMKPAERKLKREINAVVWSIDELKKNKKKSFIRDIAKNKILMVIGKENELRKIIG